MTEDELEKLLENPALELMEELIAARAKRIGATLADEWGNVPKSHPERGYSPELIRRAGG